VLRILVLYHSSCGHAEALAYAAAGGARSAGAAVDIRRVPEPPVVNRSLAAHFKLDQEAPEIRVPQLGAYDGIIVGSGAKHGRISTELAVFLDSVSGLEPLVLSGKVAAAFSCEAAEGDAPGTALPCLMANLLHLRTILVSARGYLACGGQSADGYRAPSLTDMEDARGQGLLLARTAARFVR
jgi:NAD(P)H dehydrogenase (quinone)